jgi:two-component system cell cycle response regulator DivK
MVKVLVIEDNPVNMKLAVLLLTKVGHEVLCAVDAETGLLLARAALPDLVLMDIQLPGMDGRMATSLLKQDPVTASIPVIALTAMNMEAGDEMSPIAGCDAYIAKPLSYQVLYAAIDLVLGKRAIQALPDSGRPESATRLQSQRRTAARVVAAGSVDVGILQDLIGKDPMVVQEFLTAFQISAAKIALDMETACAEGQAALAGMHAHKLKSSAHVVGARTLAGLCAEMEAAGKTGRSETLAMLLPVFRKELGAVNIFLDSWRVD